MSRENSFTKKASIAVIIAVFVVLTVLMVARLYQVFLLIFASILLSVFLRGLAHFLRRYVNLSQSIAILIVILVLISLSVGIGFLLGPNISENIENIREKGPEIISRFEESLKEFSWGESLVSNIKESADSFAEGSEARERIMGMFSSMLSIIIGILVILVVGLYMAFHPDEYTGGFLKLVPKEKRKRGGEILHKLEHALIWWMVGRFASMIVIGVLTLTGLLILDIPLAFTLALFAALLTFVPNLGPVIAFIPAFALGYIESPAKALYVAILYAGIQTLETYFITPLITKKAVSVSPALLISFEVVIGVLMGIPGLILATPLLVAVIVLVQTMYIEDVLEDDVTVLGE
jgi:predicted PurR-regulated permease PerM